MGKAVPCRNGCNKYIVVQLDETTDKWKPYDCDEVGNPIQLHDCPNNPYYQKQKISSSTSSGQAFQSPRVTQGGETLDTKRLLQAVQENTKMIMELKSIVDSRTILDTSKYEQRINEVYNIIAPLLVKDTFKPASKLQQRQDIIDSATTATEFSGDEFQRTKKFIEENDNEFSNVVETTTTED